MANYNHWACSLRAAVGRITHREVGREVLKFNWKNSVTLVASWNELEWGGSHFLWDRTIDIYIYIPGQIIIFHQPRFPWNKGTSLTKPPFGVRSCEVAIIWPDIYIYININTNTCVYLLLFTNQITLRRHMEKWLHGGPTGMVVANMAVHGPFFQRAFRRPWALGPRKRSACFETKKVSPTPLIINVAYECWLGWICMVAPATQRR